MGAKLKTLLAEYGSVAIGVYIALFLAFFAGAAVAIHFGFSFDGVAGGAGTLGAAWLVTKLAQPLRIGATILLTPLVAVVIGRFKKKPEATASEDIRSDPSARPE